MADILNQIDNVLADVSSCAFCRTPLRARGPSGDFCNEVCQWSWYTQRAKVKGGIGEEAVPVEDGWVDDQIEALRRPLGIALHDAQAGETVEVALTEPGDPWGAYLGVCQSVMANLPSDVRRYFLSPGTAWPRVCETCSTEPVAIGFRICRSCLLARGEANRPTAPAPPVDAASEPTPDVPGWPRDEQGRLVVRPRDAGAATVDLAACNDPLDLGPAIGIRYCALDEEHAGRHRIGSLSWPAPEPTPDVPLEIEGFTETLPDPWKVRFNDRPITDVSGWPVIQPPRRSWWRRMLPGGNR